MKRTIDLLCSAVVIICLLPVLLVVALLIKIDSAGPVLFRQIRVGKKGRMFSILKFRTMFVNTGAFTPPTSNEGLAELQFQFREDPRVTRVGRLLRRFSLDELPQLVNVLRGEMSLVGPRPEVPELVQLYTVEQRQRLDVLPGLTGWAQINGRGDLTTGEAIQFDLEYVRNHSLLRDLGILWRTFGVVLTGRGAY